MILATALTVYAQACHRATVENRPLIWAYHEDVWNEPRGEVGIPHKDDMTAGVFVALVPFVVVPEIATAVLIVDVSTLVDRQLAVRSIKATPAGLVHTLWTIPFGIGDGGRIWFGVPVTPNGHPWEIEATIGQVVAGRNQRLGWEDGFTFTEAVELSQDLLETIDTEHGGSV